MQIEIAFLLHHLVDVTTKFFWNLYAKHESFVSVRDYGTAQWVRVHIRVFVAFCSFHPVERHRDQRLFAIDQIVEEVLECLSYTHFRNRNLPQVALG